MGELKFKKLDPREFPMLNGESWWIVHPNNGNCECKIPQDGITVCKQPLLGIFKVNTAYDIVSVDNDHGWVTVTGGGYACMMPQYVFARYFDAEAFVRLLPDPTPRQKRAMGAEDKDGEPTFDDRLGGNG
jgi:hypothetical protein